MNDCGALLVQDFGSDRVARDAPLAPWTTFKVGGPADWLLTVRSADEVRRAASIARLRGYASLVERLIMLGAQVQRE